MSFSEKVLQIVSKIPKGKVATYGQIAKLIQNSKCKNQNYPPSPSEAGWGKVKCQRSIVKSSLLARAVGNVLHRNPTPIVVPCHRVVRSGGIIGGYKSGVEKKIELLKQEEIGFVGNLRVNLKEHLWKPDVK